MAETVIVTCQECGKKNRMPVDLPFGKTALCGKCHEPLDEADEVESEEED